MKQFDKNMVNMCHDKFQEAYRAARNCNDDTAMRWGYLIDMSNAFHEIHKIAKRLAK